MSSPLPRFVCPIDRSSLTPEPGGLRCGGCGVLFPLGRGIPILLNEDNSVFRIADYMDGAAYQGASGDPQESRRLGPLRRAYRDFADWLAESGAAEHGFDAMEIICQHVADPCVLVIGAGERGKDGRVINTDVAYASNVACICDGHDLPFEDGVFDAVIAQSVLEHVCDPQRVVAEITRVLRPGGLVYAITPFLQPVHMGAHDFTRFTYLGHRRLFRHYDDLRSGMAGGPAYSAIHLTRNMLLSLSDGRRTRAVLRFAALLVTYPLRYLDRLFSRTQGAYNAACAVYFLGRKRDSAIPDREIIAMFRGR